MQILIRWAQFSSGKIHNKQGEQEQLYKKINSRRLFLIIFYPSESYEYFISL